MLGRIFGNAVPETPVPESSQGPLPVIWLLGKTGAGKSSLVHWLTGLPGAVVGNGFQPCTRTAQSFDFPQDAPLMRFLDTRGLGEAHYDPVEDLAMAEGAAHLLVVVARLDDPVQGDVAEVLASVRKKMRDRVVLVHSGADLVSDAEERTRARAATQMVMAKAFRESVPEVELSLATGDGLDPLLDLMEAKLPEVAELLHDATYGDAEGLRWQEHRDMVLWYAGAAGGSDTLPVVGGLTGPVLQLAMLTALAQRYQVEWTWRRRGEFLAALGTATAAAYGISYGARQALKLVPVVGQTAGAATSGVVTFGTTLALGRAAALFLHKISQGEEVVAEDIRSKYAEALRKGRVKS